MRSALAYLLWLVAWGAGCTAPDVVEETDAACLRVQWDARVGVVDDGGVVTPPELECETTVGCPPPLICVPRSQEAGDGPRGQCELMTNTISPGAAIDYFGVPEFIGAVDEASAGADYTTVVFSSLPADAAFVRCAVYGCPIDQSVLRMAPTRCLIDEVILTVASATSITLPSVTGTGGVPALALSATPGCAVPSCMGDCETRELPAPATGFYVFCLAFSETALVGATSVINLSADEMGAAGEVAYTSRCVPTSLAYRGMACARDGVGSNGGLGVCTGETLQCCAPCWSQQQCTGLGGTRCVLVDETEDDEGGGAAGAVCGVLRGVVHDDRAG